MVRRAVALAIYWFRHFRLHFIITEIDIALPSRSSTGGLFESLYILSRAYADAIDYVFSSFYHYLFDFWLSRLLPSSSDSLAVILRRIFLSGSISARAHLLFRWYFISDYGFDLIAFLTVLRHARVPPSNAGLFLIVVMPCLVSLSIVNFSHLFIIFLYIFICVSFRL